MQHAQLAVTATASVIAEGGGDGEYVYVRTSADVYLGGSGVSSSNGFKLTSSDQPLQVVLYADDGPLYAVAATTATVSVLRTRA